MFVFAVVAPLTASQAFSGRRTVSIAANIGSSPPVVAVASIGSGSPPGKRSDFFGPGPLPQTIRIDDARGLCLHYEGGKRARMRLDAGSDGGRNALGLVKLAAGDEAGDDEGDQQQAEFSQRHGAASQAFQRLRRA